MKHFLTLFITALLAMTASGAANVGIGSQPVLAALTNGQYFVLTTGNASNSPVRLIQAASVSNQWAAGAAVMASNRVVVAAGSGVSVTPSGSGGVQTFTVSATGGGSGGTNFPNVNLLLGATNLTLSAGVRKAYHNQTNGSHGINLNLAVPESGYEAVYSVSNSGSSDITVTFYTNSVAANPYDIASKTNVNTFTASASAITKVKLTYTANGLWLLDRVDGPASILKFGSGITASTQGVNGLEVTISASGGSGTLPLRYVDITDYGAVGDGTTENTFAINQAYTNAAASNLWVMIPPGIFSASNLFVTAPTFGFGTNSTLKFKSDGTGIFLKADTISVNLRNFAVEGGSVSNFVSGSAGYGNRIGVSHHSRGPAVVENLTISGFDLAGLQITGDLSTQTVESSYTKNFVFLNHFGITNVPGTAEYTKVHDNHSWSNTIGIIVKSANATVSGNHITYCYQGAVWGSSTDTRGHQKWENNVMNHLGGIAIDILTNRIGGSYINNRTLGSSGQIRIYSSTNLVLTDNYGQDINVANSSCARIYFHDNYDVGGLIDQTSTSNPQLFHWNNYDEGVAIDGTGAPYYTPGGYGLTHPSAFRMRGTMTANGFLQTNQIPAITASNIVWSFETNRYQLTGLTNVVFTNLTELVTGMSGEIEAYIQNTIGATVALRWPAYGAQHGYFFKTNALTDPISATTLASGESAVVRFKAYGTNIVGEYYRLP